MPRLVSDPLMIRGVVPVVRWASLFRHEPPLSAKDADEARAAIFAAWPDWKQSYKTNVARMAHVEPSSVEVDSKEVVRLRYDGKTPMIDFPRVESLPDAAGAIDLRFCAALGIDNYSSKLWTRIGPPYWRGNRDAPATLTTVLSRYRRIAERSSRWFYDEFMRLTGDALAGHKRKDRGVLEVITIGLKIDRQDDPTVLDAWLFDDSDKRQPNLRNENLRRLMMRISGIQYDIRELASREPDAFWMSMPTAVQLDNGDLVSRTALYVVRPLGEVLQVVGVALDESESGAFASEVALKVSRWIANRI